MATWTAKMKDRDIVITSERLGDFRSFYVSDPDLSARMSDLLWFDMYVLDQEFGVGPHDVLEAVKNLEAGEPHSGVKPATQFRNPPLKGLWHKHFFSAHFLVDNILLALGKNGLSKLVEEVMDPAKSSVITQDMIDELARRATHDAVENRDKQGRITGEWLIFAKHNGKNYYLCLNTHNAGDQFIYDRIMDHCVKQFPKLAEWISAS
jgi:hypothetical protein